MRRSLVESRRGQPGVREDRALLLDGTEQISGDGSRLEVVSEMGPQPPSPRLAKESPRGRGSVNRDQSPALRKANHFGSTILAASDDTEPRMAPKEAMSSVTLIDRPDNSPS